MRGVTYGKRTKREKEMLFFVGETIANWIEKHKTDRRELLCVLSTLCGVVFTEDTPYKDDILKQVKDIDDFCNYLKFLAKNRNE